jgi:hypothetical protein
VTIIVETGAGLSNSETYISVADSLTYHAARGNNTWATITTAQHEQALRRATDYMVQVYRNRWKGVRMLSTQALDWPRAYVYLEPVITGANLEFPNLVADDIVPAEVARACADLALKAAAGELYSDQSQGVVREKIGPIEVEYDRFSPRAVKYSAIDALLRPFLASSEGRIPMVPV